MKNNIKKAFTYIVNVAPFFFCVVAIISTTWYLLSSYNMMNNWWSLPLLAILTGILSLVIPLICSRQDYFNSFISAGWSILIILVTNAFLKKDYFYLALIIFAIALITDILLYGINSFHFGEFILNIIISCLTAIILVNISSPIIKYVILVIAYNFTIIYDFHPVFSRKKKTTKTEEKPVEKVIDFDIE